MQKKDELYNKSIQQFISILTNIKLQMRLNPEKAEENINEVIILLRKQIIIPEVKASLPKQKSLVKVSATEEQKSSKEVKVEKIPAVEEQKVSVALPVTAELLVNAPVTEEPFVSADKIKEAEET
jgi:hypothetical protein